MIRNLYGLTTYLLGACTLAVFLFWFGVRGWIIGIVLAVGAIPWDKAGHYLYDAIPDALEWWRGLKLREREAVYLRKLEQHLKKPERKEQSDDVLHPM